MKPNMSSVALKEQNLSVYTLQLIAYFVTVENTVKNVLFLAWSS